MKALKMRLTVDVTYKVDDDDTETSARLERALGMAVAHLRENAWFEADTEVVDVAHTVDPVPLRDVVDDPNSEHPDFDRDEWIDEVFQRNTNLGYWDWVENQIEQSRE